jgi:quercetin dioxygenase-like cupin family protein
MPEITTVDELSDTPHAEIFDEHRPRAVRLELEADERVPPHSHPGTDVVLYLVSGDLELSLDGETYDLSAGQIARFGGDREISPRACEPSTAVVVFAPAEKRGD